MLLCRRGSFPERYDIAGRIYDVNDNRSISEGGGITTFKYDSAGRVIEVNDIESRVIEYTYGDRGLRTSLDYSDSSNYYITYDYDKLGRLDKIHPYGTIRKFADYDYDELGRRTLCATQTLAYDANIVYEYDIASRLTRLTNNLDTGGDIEFEYANYDKVGNRLSMKVDDSNTQWYTYDDIYQLTYVDYNDGNSMYYDYDTLGNRTGTYDGTVTTYLHNKLNQYYSVDSVTHKYDKNGNLTDDGTYLYYYDFENRLTDVNDQSDAAIASYKYDFAGRRVRKIVYGSPDVVTKYCYDGMQVIEEFDDSDTLLRRFVYGAGIDEALAMYINGDQWYYYQYDGLGSVVALCSSSSLVERYEYDVFGNVTIKDADNSVISVSSVANPYYFTGRRLDDETSLYYHRARYYSADLGRFLQTDPIGYYDSMNLYQYCINNPINYVDPMGLRTDLAQALASGAITWEEYCALMGIKAGAGTAAKVFAPKVATTTLPFWKKALIGIGLGGYVTKQLTPEPLDYINFEPAKPDLSPVMLPPRDYSSKPMIDEPKPNDKFDPVIGSLKTELDLLDSYLRSMKNSEEPEVDMDFIELIHDQNVQQLNGNNS